MGGSRSAVVAAIVVDDEYSAREGWQPIPVRRSTPSTGRQNDSSTNSAKRDLEGIVGQESCTEQSAFFLDNRSEVRSEGSFASRGKQSRQAVTDTRNFSSDEKLSSLPIAIVLNSTEQEVSVVDGQSGRTSEASLSFQSTLLKIFDISTAHKQFSQELAYSTECWDRFRRRHRSRRSWQR